jgi:hypothetical protein
MWTMAKVLISHVDVSFRNDHLRQFTYFLFSASGLTCTTDSKGKHNAVQLDASVADLDPHVFGPSGPDPLVRGMDPDPSIIMQK